MATHRGSTPRPSVVTEGKTILRILWGNDFFVSVLRAYWRGASHFSERHIIRPAHHPGSVRKFLLRGTCSSGHRRVGDDTAPNPGIDPRWAALLQRCFDPYRFGGGYQQEFFSRRHSKFQIARLSRAGRGVLDDPEASLMGISGLTFPLCVTTALLFRAL